jgi:hypothetical protein
MELESNFCSIKNIYNSDSIAICQCEDEALNNVSNIVRGSKTIV